jgi:hypothetical protein
LSSDNREYERDGRAPVSFFFKKKTKKGKVFPSMMTKEIRRKSKL